MKRYVYVRVSTEGQSYERQDHIIKQYFAQKGIDPTSIDAIVKEKISSKKDLSDRKFHELLSRCKDGDYIYTAGLDRIGRTQVEMINLIDYATKKGIYLVVCNEDRILENKTAEGQLYMSIMTALANQERNRISSRTKDTLDAYQEQIRKNKGKGFWKKNGEWHNGKLGRKKGCNLDVARAASTKSKQDAAVEWRENSVGYDFVRELLQKGTPRMEIIEQFNRNHKRTPGTKEMRYTDGYSTPKGAGLSIATLCKWYKEMEATLIV